MLVSLGYQKPAKCKRENTINLVFSFIFKERQQNCTVERKLWWAQQRSNAEESRNRFNKRSGFIQRKADINRWGRNGKASGYAD